MSFLIVYEVNSRHYLLNFDRHFSGNLIGCDKTIKGLTDKFREFLKEMPS